MLQLCHYWFKPPTYLTIIHNPTPLVNQSNISLPFNSLSSSLHPISLSHYKLFCFLKVPKDFLVYVCLWICILWETGWYFQSCSNTLSYKNVTDPLESTSFTLNFCETRRRNYGVWKMTNYIQYNVFERCDL